MHVCIYYAFMDGCMYIYTYAHIHKYLCVHMNRSVIQAVGGDNCYESNLYLSIALLSSIPTSTYTKNVFILGSGF